MHHLRPFRFSAMCPAVNSGAELAAFARMAESIGYSSVVTGEHIAFGTLGPIATLTAAACATTSLRLISHVFNNELRHPALLAQEAATLDLLAAAPSHFHRRWRAAHPRLRGSRGKHHWA